jgi:hypothetical protein
MLDAPRAVRRRRRRRAYERFLRAATRLAAASEACRPLLSSRSRIAVDAALLRVGAADRTLGQALAGRERRQLANAVSGLEQARRGLTETARDTAVDVARRRSISLVPR